MVALEIRCVLLSIATSVILVETSRELRNIDEDIAQEDDALHQALVLVHMLRTDYLKMYREKQVLSDTLALLTQHLPAMIQQMPSTVQPLPSPSMASLSPITISRRPTSYRSESTNVSTENWFNSSTTLAAPNSSFSSTSSTTASSASKTSTLIDIPQRRFMMDQSKNTSLMKKESSTLSTKNELVIPLKKVAAKNPAQLVAKNLVKQDKKIKQQVKRKSARKPTISFRVTHSIAKNPARQQQAVREPKKKNFWRHLSTPPRTETPSRDPVVAQIARELINELQQGNTKTLNVLKNKILMSRIGSKSLREGNDDENNNGNGLNAETNEGNQDKAIASAEESVKPETNEANVNGENDNTEPLAASEATTNAKNGFTSVAQAVDTGNIATNHTNNASPASTINQFDLWPTTRPKPTYKGTFKLYLSRSSRLPTPLPKNNAYCFWEPKSPMCGLSI